MFCFCLHAFWLDVCPCLVDFCHKLQAQFCNQSMETITKDTDRDFFMSPQEAIEYGLVDAIIAKPLELQTRELTKA